MVVDWLGIINCWLLGRQYGSLYGNCFVQEKLKRGLEIVIVMLFFFGYVYQIKFKKKKLILMFILLVLMFVVVVFFNYKFNYFCNYSVEY